MIFNLLKDSYTNINELEIKKYMIDFYNKYDSNYEHLNSVLNNSTKITINDSELIGVDKMISLFKNENVQKIEHKHMNVTVQPIDGETILIIVNGLIKINFKSDCFFNDVLVIKCCSNNLFIKNYVLKLFN